MCSAIKIHNVCTQTNHCGVSSQLTLIVINVISNWPTILIARCCDTVLLKFPKTAFVRRATIENQ